MIVLAWFTATRFAAVARLSKDDLRTLSKAGTRGPDLERVLPAQANWPSHNYTHLVEQPTVFYAVVVILALAQTPASELNIALAWTYTALRILHSIWQMSVNRLPVRMTLFAASSLCLIALAINAVRATL